MPYMANFARQRTVERQFSELDDDPSRFGCSCIALRENEEDRWRWCVDDEEEDEEEIDDVSFFTSPMAKSISCASRVL